jgi:hypothetical protein
MVFAPDLSDESKIIAHIRKDVHHMRTVTQRQESNSGKTCLFARQQYSISHVNLHVFFTLATIAFPLPISATKIVLYIDSIQSAGRFGRFTIVHNADMV